jgi:hypothetical protein
MNDNAETNVINLGQAMNRLKGSTILSPWAPGPDFNTLGRLDGERAARERLTFGRGGNTRRQIEEFEEAQIAEGNATIDRMRAQCASEAQVRDYVRAWGAAFNQHCASALSAIEHSSAT